MAGQVHLKGDLYIRLNFILLQAVFDPVLLTETGGSELKNASLKLLLIDWEPQSRDNLMNLIDRGCLISVLK